MTLNTLQKRFFRIAENHEHTSPDKLLDFRHNIDKHDYSIEEDSTFTKDHHSDHFILPIDPSATEPLIYQTINTFIYWIGNVHVELQDLLNYQHR